MIRKDNDMILIRQLGGAELRVARDQRTSPKSLQSVVLESGRAHFGNSTAPPPMWPLPIASELRFPSCRARSHCCGPTLSSSSARRCVRHVSSARRRGNASNSVRPLDGSRRHRERLLAGPGAKPAFLMAAMRRFCRSCEHCLRRAGTTCCNAPDCCSRTFCRLPGNGDDGDWPGLPRYDVGDPVYEVYEIL